MNKPILFKRPVITVFFFYAAFLISLDYAGIFEPSKQSVLYHFASYKKTVIVEGKVISEPEPVKNGQRFVLKARMLNGYERVNEKILAYAAPGYQIAYGDIISMEGRPSKPKEADFPLVFDYGKYLARTGIYTILQASSFQHIESVANPVKKLALGFRKDLLKKTDDYFKKPYSGLFKSLIIGDKAALEPQTKENFADAGLMHVLVVSGLHVGFAGGLLLTVFKICGFSLKKASLLSMPFIFLYVISTGANPPALRAAIMFSSVLIALALDREPLIYNSLALSALLILLFAPQQLFTASFQLSYAATAGIIYFYRKIYSVFGNIKNAVLRFFTGVFSVTVSAQIALMPVCLYYFAKISLISFAANIIIVPLIGVIMPLGFAFYFSAFIFPSLSFALSKIISFMLHFILVSVNVFAQSGFSSFNAAKPPVLHIVIFFLFFLAITHFNDRKRFIFPGICLILSFLNIFAPAFADKDKVIYSVYDRHNVTVLRIKNGSSNSFIFYRKRGGYDKYYIDSFLRFLSFSGIKKAEMSFIGFKESDTARQIKNANPAFAKTEKTGIVDMNFYERGAKFDMAGGKIYIDGNAVLEMKKNPSFYYHLKKKTFKIKDG